MAYNQFENICRTCLSNEGVMESLFTVHISDTELVRVVDFIRRMTSIKIAKGDGLPENVCTCCIEMLCKAYSFSQLCISSNSLLQLQRKRLQDEIFEAVVKDEVNKDHIIKISDDDAKDFMAIEQNGSTNSSDKKNIIFAQSEMPGFNKEEVLVLDDDFEIVHENELEVKDFKEEEMYEQSQLLPFRCNECSESFSSSVELKKHEFDHDSSRPYKCEECLKKFFKKTHLTVHMRSHVKANDRQYVCATCGQTFVYSYLLKQHTYKHTAEKPFPCMKCKKGCLTAESLRRHMKTHDDSYKKKKHVCSVCDKEFPYPSFLAEHMKNHTGEKPFLCPTCGRGFRQSGALAYHLRSHTGFKPYKCQICNNSFSSRGILRVHMRRHTNERPYVCDICGMAFRQSTDMKSHRRTHTGDKRVLCTVCGKRMATTGQLTVHLRSHTGEKPFGCDVCLKAFTTRTMLVKHYRIHTGERPYSCTICQRAFNQSSTLKTHMATHRKNNDCNNRGIKCA